MIRQGLQADGITVSISKLCRWFEVPRRTVYYRPVKSEPKVQARFAEPIKAMIEESPSFGYRTVAHLLGFNKNTVQRIFQLMGWQVRRRPIGFRPRVQALPSVATAPNERWSTDMCRVWAGRDGWATLALVIDCHTRELLGWHLSRSGRASTASSALEHALIRHFDEAQLGDDLFGGKTLARHVRLLLAGIEFSLSTWVRNNRSRHRLYSIVDLWRLEVRQLPRCPALPLTVDSR
ncbi:DDE-type integrase/transposase/recombinase [Ralstonia soli]|uniref:DDE-type integrase/transposase/recombinase n=1 Tax=Ralstonia soli TaxID=2953896 RepID=A0ABT1AHA6_9RALS|nr:DDE-type integrase/transposase/recombinase [Ralstonia soli]MCO5397780.1 DDE-type integrase/transposase/recombinase [Ralstonia soli]